MRRENESLIDLFFNIISYIIFNIYLYLIDIMYKSNFSYILVINYNFD